MSTTTPMPTTSTSAVPSSQPSAPSSTGPQNSPLLFFVALGFGVVFTNLWIIVGVKYCFRYNARNRARQQDESGEPIDLANMTQHRRRRREKKLMTVDEVNDRFPVTKYKTWVSSRAAQGLPTEGGVSQSRAASVRDAEGVIEPVGESSKSVITADVASTSEALPSTPTTSGPVKDAASPQSRLSEARTNEESTAPANAVSEKSSEAAGTAPATTENATETLPVATRLDTTTTSVDDEEEDAIAAAVPGADAMLEAPGDSCAICIDTLEDEDDVRGLSCGHAFHAVCIDPWLMNRRACCPLCKADYYVPKPRPQVPEGQEGDANAPATTLDQIVPRRPSLAVGVPAGGISRYVPRLTGRVDTLPPERRSQPQGAGANSRGNQEPPGIISARVLNLFRRGSSAPEPASQTEAPAPAPAPAPTPAEPSSNADSEVVETTRTRRWAPSMPHWRRNRNNDGQATTPGQLEAGTS